MTTKTDSPPLTSIVLVTLLEIGDDYGSCSSAIQQHFVQKSNLVLLMNHSSFLRRNVKFSPNNDGMIWWQVEFLIQLCLWESNTETGKNENRETDSEEQGSKTYSCLYFNFSFFRFYEVLQWGRDVKRQICNLKFCYCSVENSILVVMSMARRLNNPRKGVILLPRELDRIGY
jgi:hypothetical protein